ncbi:MAG: hypothetical protein AAGI52_13870 [Bacteroidota bacterium]
MTRLLALTLLLVSAPAFAQTLVASFSQDAPAPAATPSLAAYAGFYATDGGMIEVRDGGSALVLVAHGAPVAERLVGFAAPSYADARTATLLDAWVSGDLAPMIAAVRPERRERATESFERYRAALVRGHGEVIAASVVGTFERVDGPETTLVRILFEHGTEWASFVWNEQNELVTVTRGLSPVVIGMASPTARDTFAGGGTEITFEREADGRIDTVTIGERFVAIR